MSMGRQCGNERSAGRAGQGRLDEGEACGQCQWSGWMVAGPCGVYLGAVLSHGVVVETSLGLELLPAVLALEGILELQTRDPREAALGHLPQKPLEAALPSDTPPCAS